LEHNNNVCHDHIIEGDLED